jgi:hypothetical protein
MRLGKSPFLKNQRRKISLDCPFKWVGLDIFEMKEKTLVSDFKLMLQTCSSSEVLRNLFHEHLANIWGKNIV